MVCLGSLWYIFSMVENLQMSDSGKKIPETAIENPEKLNEEWNLLQDRLELIQRQAPYLQLVLEDFQRLNKDLIEAGLSPELDELACKNLLLT